MVLWYNIYSLLHMKYLYNISCDMRKTVFRGFDQVRHKPACTVSKGTNQLCSNLTQLVHAFISQIVQSLFFFNMKFQASSHHLWLQTCFETPKTGFLVLRSGSCFNIFEGFLLVYLRGFLYLRVLFQYI